MAKTKELSKDDRDKIVDLQDHRQVAWWEQLVRLFSNVRNTK